MRRHYLIATMNARTLIIRLTMKADIKSIKMWQWMHLATFTGLWSAVVCTWGCDAKRGSIVQEKIVPRMRMVAEI